MMKMGGVCYTLLCLLLLVPSLCHACKEGAWVRATGDWLAAKGDTAWRVDSNIGLFVMDYSTCIYHTDPISGLVPGQTYYWKVTIGGSWAENYGCFNTDPTNGNCKFVTPLSGTVIFHFDYANPSNLYVENVAGSSPATTAAAASTTVSSTTGSATSGSSTGSSFPVGSGKQVFTHFMMGNVYWYDQAHFQSDFSKAKSLGIDAFALNAGLEAVNSNDKRLALAYAAAAATGFKVFISFDLSYSFSANDIINLVKQYGKLAGQYTYNGKILVSTFGGTGNTFGYSSVNAAWSAIRTSLSTSGYNIFLVPNFALAPNDVYSSTYSAIDGEFSWGAWPSPNSALTDDSAFITAANNAGKVYMAPLSPLFYTHLSYKNYLYDYDGLWFSRWQQLINLKPHLIEIITWNDWGESHYIGPIDSDERDWPTDSGDYVRGFDHIALLDTLPYFIQWYKSGVAPTVTQDIVVYWYRPHLKGATASSDRFGVPRVYTQYMADSGSTPAQVLDDKVFVVAILRSAGTIVVNSGGVSTTINAAAGANLYTAPLNVGQQTVTLSRNSAQVCSNTGAKSVVGNPQTYNFNVYVGGCKSN